MKTKLIIPVVRFTLIIIIFSACSQAKRIDLASEKTAILELHNAQRDYHFNKDSIAFANQLSDNFISVNKGLVSSQKKTKTISRYHSYFSSVEFLKWDDVSDPIIKFSDDGSMAYTIVDKIVTNYYKDNQSNIIEDETHFAWTTIYKKHEDEWKIDCVTSTNKLVKE